MADREDKHFRRYERNYIISDDSLPVYVGEGLGDLDYKDTVELCVIKRTAQGLPATPEFISLFAPPPAKLKRGGESPHTPRASKNNPYICVHCDYRSTRYGNMVTHLENSHGDYRTDPRGNRY